MRLRVLVVSALLLLGAAFGAPSAAQADIYNNMYPTATIPMNCQSGTMGDPFCRTDNAALTYFAQGTIGATGEINIDDVLFGQFDPTDLNVTYDGTPSYSGSAETDLIYQSGTVPAGLVGITWCNNAASALRCDQQYIRTTAGNPSHNLICHESGHGVGLTHGDDADPYQDPSLTVSLGCMRNPENYISSPTLGSHNVGEINATY